MCARAVQLLITERARVSLLDTRLHVQVELLFEVRRGAFACEPRR